MWWSCLRSQCSPQKQSAKHFSCHSSRKGRCMNMPFGRDYWTVTILRAALTKLLLSKFWRLHFGGTLRSPFSSWLVFMTLVTTATEHITDFSTFVLSNILQEPLSLLLLFHAMTKQLGWCVNAAPGPGAGPITSLAHWTIWAGISRVTPAQPRRSNEKRNQVPPAILIWTLGTSRLGVLYQEPGACLEAGVPALLWSLHNSVGPLQDQVAQLQCRALEKSGPKGTERNERD